MKESREASGGPDYQGTVLPWKVLDFDKHLLFVPGKQFSFDWIGAIFEFGI